VIRKLPKGTRVRLVGPVERFPHFVADEGLTGVVVRNNNDSFSVRMDQPIDGAEEWDNCIEWTAPYEEAHDPREDLEVVKD
jgi:hypothetical protein